MLPVTQLVAPIDNVIAAPTSSESDESNKSISKNEEIEILITRRGKIIRKRNIEEIERDHRDPSFNPKKQKKNRNVLSNLIHHLMKYLSNA